MTEQEKGALLLDHNPAAAFIGTSKNQNVSHEHSRNVILLVFKVFCFLLL